MADGRPQQGESTQNRARFKRFIGIALGGGRGKTTSVARIEPGEEGLRLVEARARAGHRGGGEASTPVRPFRDEVLLDYLRHWVDDETLVAVDAPLTLPPCVRCTLDCPGAAACEVPVVAWMRDHAPNLVQRADSDKPASTPYTQRATELLLESATLEPREALGQGMGPLAARATYLRRAMAPTLRLNDNLIEVHPRATLIRCFGSEAERRTRHGETEAAWDARKELLAALTSDIDFDRVWPELVVRNVHVFHAVVASMTARQWVTQGWTGPEDLAQLGGPVAEAVKALGDLWQEDGWIWAPPGAGR